MLRLLLITTVSLNFAQAQVLPFRVYRDPRAPIEIRVQDLVSRMTLEEKIDLLHGNEMETHANKRLGIPSLKMADGPMGVRWERATAFPAAISMASTFDAELIHQLTEAMAQETLAKGRDMLLGPCVNISRAPLGGRNFESFGEDPFLTSTLASSYVRGLQENGVLASTKHFALNDQERDRLSINVEADERTMREIHLPAFEAAIEAGTWSIMAAYNRVNGPHASESPSLLKTLLKEEWGFRGFVISDWRATHSTVAAANAGLDLEMPFGTFFGGEKLLKAVHHDEVSESVIDDKVKRILRAMFAGGAFDRKNTDRPKPSIINSPKHRSLALRAAQQGMVLLKNDREALPLEQTSATNDTKSPGIFRLAVIGPNASIARTGGGGSSKVEPYQAVSPFQALLERANSSFFEARQRNAHSLKVDFARGASIDSDVIAFDRELVNDAPSGQIAGLTAEYFNNADLNGSPVLKRVDRRIDFKWNDRESPGLLVLPKFSVRWSGKLRVPRSETYQLAVTSDDGARLYIDGKPVINDWSNRAPTTHTAWVRFDAGRDYDVRLEYYNGLLSGVIRFGFIRTVEQEERERIEAVRLASAADAAVIFAGYSDAFEGEDVDRASMSLPMGQDALIEAVARVNPRTIVILNSGGSTLMPWADKVGAIVQAWYPGQEGGYAIADLLLGRANFSGKLPVSFYRAESDASSFGNYPGENGRVRYAERIYIGYRHLDRAGIEPLFPFGHGLSYTSFALSHLNILNVRNQATDPILEVSAVVTNTGSREGAEVVQLYVHDEKPAIDRPVQELKGFQKIFLMPGQSGAVHFELNARSFAYYDVGSHRWVVHPGRYELRLGNSSRDVGLRSKIVLR